MPASRKSDEACQDIAKADGPGLMRSREPNALAHWVRALSNKQALESGDARSLLSLVEKQAITRGDEPALIDEREHVTYGELVVRARAYSAWARAQGLGDGDVVCLIMPNCAEYVAIWLGITDVGCVTALINTNIVGAGLAHCIGVSEPKQIIIAASLLQRVSAALQEVSTEAGVWVHDNALTRIRAAAGPNRPPETVQLSPEHPALLIFTSGTTGFPKGAYVTHGRILEWSGWFAGMMDARPEDRLFDCLPMYHSVGGVVAVGAMLYSGGAVVIRQHFSASRFWPDVVQSGCTIFQYIGELCRYLTRAPDSPESRSHRLRLCCGNGLRADVWVEFQSRFAVPRLLEYYAATEGNVSLFNCEGKPGAIGRVPAILAHSFPVALIRLDERSGLPLRGSAGLCVPCSVDEAGEAIGRIDPKSRSASRRFDGYTDADASASKVLRDVFTPGDAWFRTGDLMRCDKAGYFYFVDRLGSSFRWKGENVSASEVASVIMRCPGVVDAVVFGVAVEGTEGRAGMAAISAEDGFRLETLKAHMTAHLPSFARPLFLRLCKTIPATATFKLRQEELAREGLTARGEGDSLWFSEPTTERLVPCDEHLLCAIASGSMRL
jgi:fatty-acyl-CoA synthase